MLSQRSVFPRRLPHLRAGRIQARRTKEHDEFGKTLVGETWKLDPGQQSWQ
jgi:hypothetical protein